MSADKYQKSLGKPGKILSRTEEDPGVETLAASPYGFAPDVVSFRASEITRLRSIGPDHSLIVLANNEEYVVALPHKDLSARICGAEDATIDLKEYAYAGKKEELVKELKAAFKEAAEREKYAALEGLTYKAWVRSPQRDNFTECTFKGSDIDFKQASEGGSKVGGQCVTFVTRLPDGSPFGDNCFIMETTLESFNKQARKAAAEGQAVLDMRDYSKRKGFTFAEKRNG
ncbi:MAG: hypothetical protein GC185_01315 [Alphaproteobacteria bacterium]|nr:hypothetical protein [Alphaproteobacteria bacterium]